MEVKKKNIMGAKNATAFWHTKYIRYLRRIFVGSE